MRVLSLLLLPLCAHAVEVGGIEFPKQWTLDKTELVLNGAGLREYGLLGIDVYAAALYLVRPETNVETVLDSRTPKVLHMYFFRDISREDTVRAWDYSFAENCRAPCVLPAVEIAAFRAFIPDSRAGDNQTYHFYPERVVVLSQGRRIGEVNGAVFARLLLSTWVGAAPPTPELRAALMGQ